MNRLFELSERVIKAGIKVILVQIDEAHSTAWPMALQNQPEPQQTLTDRIKRAKHFVETYNPPYDVYIDGWKNKFANKFRAWPDKYHCIDDNLCVVAKAEYHSEYEMEAVVVEDYSVLLERLIVKMNEKF